MSVVLDPATSDLARRFRDYAHFHAHLKIRNRTNRLVEPLHPNRFQRRLHNAYCAARSEGRPFRGICVKSRQVGVSTYAQSFIGTEAFTKAGVNALTITHEDEASTNLHAMLELMYDELPASIKPAKDSREQGKRLVLGHGSRITVRTAGARESGRSFALTHLHASEVAFWPDAATTLLALRQTMQPVAGTWELVESTANGIVDVGQAFFDEWRAAVEGESEYEPFFFPWYDDPGYTMRPAEGLQETLSDEETELARRHHLTLPQLAWRRWSIANRCGRSLDKFRQEYPTTAGEAFLVSGRPFFDAQRVAAMPIAAPHRRGAWVVRGHSTVAGYSKESRVDWRDDADGHALIYTLPQPGRKYAVAVDPAGQVESSEAEAFADRHDSEDYSVITVVDRLTLEVVAQWRDRIDIGLVGYHAAIIGRVYNQALVAVEMTGGYGQVVLDALKRVSYAPQYHREVFDERTRKLTRKLGWDTTTATRPKILEGLNDMLRDHPERLKSEWLQREMRVFVKGKRPEAAPGHHDDVVLSTAIALEVAKEYPQAVVVARRAA